MVQDIIQDVRDTLSDQDSQRWDDTRLIRLIDKAQKDITRKIRCLKDINTIAIVEDQSEYSLDSNVIQITRAVFSNKKLDFITRAELDAKNSEWDKETAEEPTHVVYDKTNWNRILVYPIPTTAAGNITLHFDKLSETIAMSSASLEIGDMWEQAVQHYVCGHALRADQDTQNRQFGAEELQFYVNELKTVLELSSRDFVQGAQYTTAYRGI